MKTLLPEEHIMKFDLDEEQSDIRNMVRRFTEREITPYAGAWDETQRFPREIYHKMAELGLMGMTTPGEYGGRGALSLLPGPVYDEVGSRRDASPPVVSLLKHID